MVGLAIMSVIVPLLVVGGIIVAIVYAFRKRSPGSAPQKSVNPRDIFFYLMTTIALYLSVGGVILVIFSLADRWFSGPGAGRPGAAELRAGISTIIVAFPVLAYLTGLVWRKVRSGEIEGRSRLRHGFTYFNLFLVVITAMVDLMLIINVFLSGDLTARFATKALGLLLVVGLVFRYYQLDIQTGGHDQEPLSSGESEVAV